MANPNTPEFALETSDEQTVLRVSGDWTVRTVQIVDEDLRALESGAGVTLDVSGLGQLDTAGAFVIDRTLRQLSDAPADIVGDHRNAENLIGQVHAVTDVDEPKRPAHGGLVDMLERTGRGFMNMLSESRDMLAFLGETLVTTFRLVLTPWKLRWTSIVSVLEEAGLDAMPIIAFLSFFVGMVVAFIGATTLRDLGSEIFVVELIGFAMLRELGVMMTGIVLAGRTNSSFTAQIGTMKMRQEIDAMQTLGLKPMDVLVAPRILAMVVATPVLAFVGTIAGIAGGVMEGWMALDINPALFLDRLQSNVPLDQFWVGMSKAPVFGFVVALIACRQGLNVGGSVQSLGSKTTTSVVQAIFSIIVIDALFAIFYMEMGI
ncbi:MAG: ABC transporter permease [Hyphomonas sp.]|uniref:ABC transporter permease n=1 Tax=Hyphomonas sp. TaxID=87 RepID=UPI000C633B00|nr:ABC transporter permease [Hyphomonas sp.]MAM08767.1 ABC transporter permease [Hyphomonas sp.]